MSYTQINQQSDETSQITDTVPMITVEQINTTQVATTTIVEPKLEKLTAIDRCLTGNFWGNLCNFVCAPFWACVFSVAIIGLVFAYHIFCLCDFPDMNWLHGTIIADIVMVAVSATIIITMIRIWGEKFSVNQKPEDIKDNQTKSEKLIDMALTGLSFFMTITHAVLFMVFMCAYFRTDYYRGPRWGFWCFTDILYLIAHMIGTFFAISYIGNRLDEVRRLYLKQVNAIKEALAKESLDNQL